MGSHPIHDTVSEQDPFSTESKHMTSGHVSELSTDLPVRRSQLTVLQSTTNLQHRLTESNYGWWSLLFISEPRKVTQFVESYEKFQILETTEYTRFFSQKFHKKRLVANLAKFSDLSPSV